jgi:hypothetical protein
MGCCDETNIDGQTVRNITLVNAEIVNGRMTGTIIGTDCAGRDLRAGTAIATCVDLQAAIDALPEFPEFPVVIEVRQINVLQDHRIQLVMSDGTTLVTETGPGVYTDHELIEGTGLLNDPVRGDPEKIAALFQTCAGSPHEPGNTIPTCAEMGEAIEEALQFEPCVFPPPMSEAAELPTTLYGGRAALLGMPVGFLDIGGFRVPHYGRCEPGSQNNVET